MMDFVNWDDEQPNTNGNIKLMFQTINQLLCFHWLELLDQYLRCSEFLGNIETSKKRRAL